MKKHARLEYCNVADKYTYSSEAKALKFVSARNDLTRAYYCPHCDGYHTTSKSIGQVISYGVLGPEEIESFHHFDNITIDLVAERLKQLKEKLV